MKSAEFVYGGVLAIFSTSLIVFGVRNALRQRGELAAFREGVRSAFVFLPLTAVVFLNAAGVLWLNRNIWKLYFALLVIFIIHRLVSPVYRPYWNDLKEKYLKWPFISSFLALAFLLVMLPAVFILVIYAFR